MLIDEYVRNEYENNEFFLRNPKVSIALLMDYYPTRKKDINLYKMALMDARVCSWLEDYLILRKNKSEESDMRVIVERIARCMIDTYGLSLVNCMYLLCSFCDCKLVNEVIWNEVTIDKQEVEKLRLKGINYIMGDGVEVNEKLAFTYFKQAAELGDGDAMSDVGYCYEGGEAGVKDIEEASYWYRKAVLRGNIKGAYNLGNVYHKGRFCGVDYVKAEYYYKIAADAGFSKALNNLAILYDSGYGDCIKQAEIMKLYLAAAEKNNSYAQHTVGYRYYYGIQVERNIEEAEKWLELAVRNGNESARSLLNEVRIDKASKTDMKKANRDLQVDSMSAEELFGFALDYLEGRNGVLKNVDKGISTMKLAAEEGYAEACYKLGLIYEQGRIIPPDYESAVRWYEKAAEKELVAAYNNLGVNYFLGRGVQKDMVRAAHYYERAVAAGVEEAYYNLSICYKYGDGVVQDLKKAFDLAYKAATVSNIAKANAQFSVADFYDRGLLDERDIDNAIQWMEKAVKNGYREARLRLAELYEEIGELEKAVFWCKEAIKDGNQMAEDMLSRLERLNY